MSEQELPEEDKRWVWIIPKLKLSMRCENQKRAEHYKEKYGGYCFPYNSSGKYEEIDKNTLENSTFEVKTEVNHLPPSLLDQ